MNIHILLRKKHRPPFILKSFIFTVFSSPIASSPLVKYCSEQNVLDMKNTAGLTALELAVEGQRITLVNQLVHYVNTNFFSLITYFFFSFHNLL